MNNSRDQDTVMSTLKSRCIRIWTHDLTAGKAVSCANKKIYHTATMLHDIGYRNLSHPQHQISHILQA